MRTLIIGAKGQLGRDLVAVFSAQGETTGRDLPELDITMAGQAGGAMAEAVPDVVINAAAYTDVERAEGDREAAFRVNVAGARRVAAACAATGIPVVYYSTDYVFDGRKRTPYGPEDPVAPRGVYAVTKAEGEAATRQANPAHYVIRTAWLFGPGGNNFVEKILRVAASRPVLQVVEDEVGSPTYTRDLAEATACLCRTNAFGTYHAANAGCCSRYEFAKAIIRCAGLATTVEPCRADQFPTKAPRPAYSVLSSEMLEAVCGYKMRPWEEALEEYITRRRIRP